MSSSGELRLLVCSANLGNKQPDEKSLAAWIPCDGVCSRVVVENPKYPVMMTPDEAADRKKGKVYDNDEEKFDIIVIGLQESTFDPPKNYRETSDHSDRDSLRRVSTGIQKTVHKTKGTIRKLNSLQPVPIQEWSGTVLSQQLADWLPSYSAVVNFSRGEMRLLVFVHALRPVQVLHTAAQNTGMAGLPNKAGIVAQIVLERTRLAFLSAHLEAHEGANKYAVRCNSLADILQGTAKGLHDVSLTSHYMFVLGDLNFRSELSDEDLSDDQQKARVFSMLHNQDWKGLNAADELHRALRVKDCLVGFRTPFCNFPPTFKLRRESGLNYLDQRRPSYTDRILWKTGRDLEQGIQPLIYEPIEEFASSDHKPVRAVFEVLLNEPCILRPIMKRRSSVRNFAMMIKKDAQRDIRADTRKQLHMFVSDLSCSLASTQRNALLAPLKIHESMQRMGPPNPYLLLVSYPEAVIRKPHKGWKRLSSKVMFWKTTEKGWRRSSVKMATNAPTWEEEEIHAEIKTHTADGSPIDLAGSMLRLTVMDRRKTGDDVPLGTFALNLVTLIKNCPTVGEDRPECDIHHIPVDGPLLLYGRETGRIRCSIEVWWMTEALAKLTGATANAIASMSTNSRDFVNVRSGDDRYYQSQHHLTPRERQTSLRPGSRRWWSGSNRGSNQT